MMWVGRVVSKSRGLDFLLPFIENFLDDWSIIISIIERDSIKSGQLNKWFDYCLSLIWHDTHLYSNWSLCLEVNKNIMFPVMMSYKTLCSMTKKESWTFLWSSFAFCQVSTQPFAFEKFWNELMLKSGPSHISCIEEQQWPEDVSHLHGHGLPLSTLWRWS